MLNMSRVFTCRASPAASIGCRLLRWRNFMRCPSSQDATNVRADFRTSIFWKFWKIVKIVFFPNMAAGGPTLGAKQYHGVWDHFACQNRTILRKTKSGLFLGRANSGRFFQLAMSIVTWAPPKLENESDFHETYLKMRRTYTNAMPRKSALALAPCLRSIRLWGAIAT